MDSGTLEYEAALIKDVRADMALGKDTKLHDAHKRLKDARHRGFDEADDASLLVVYLHFWTLVCGVAGLKAVPTKLSRTA